MTERKLTVPSSIAPKKIAKIQFGMLDTEEIKLAAEIRVSNREIYQMPQRNSAPLGCMDPRLGISDKQSACKTCGYVALLIFQLHCFDALASQEEAD